MKKSISVLLCVLMLSALVLIPISAEDAPPSNVYYPNGTIILDESMIKDDLESAFEHHTGSSTATWNTETDRLQLSANASAAGIVELVQYPEGLDYYTVSADLYLTVNEYGNRALLAMGINSGNKWNTGCYFQLYVYNDGSKPGIFIMNYDINGQYATSAIAKELEADYEYGVTKLSVKITVDEDFVNFYVNDTYFSTIKKTKLGVQSGNPFFLIRNECTMEVDNLLIYSGVTAPDYDKVIGNVGPINAPDIPQEGDDSGDNSSSEAPSIESTAPSSNDTTASPSVDTTASPSDDTTTTTQAAAEEEKSGCGAVLTSGISLALLSLFGLGLAVKKND